MSIQDELKFIAKHELLIMQQKYLYYLSVSVLKVFSIFIAMPECYS